MIRTTFHRAQNFIAAGVLLALLLISCAATTPPPPDPAAVLQKTYEPGVLRGDLEYLWETLNEVHPDLYALTDREQLVRQYRQIDSSLTRPLTRVEFYLKIAPLISNIKDGHTYLSLPFHPDILAEMPSVLFPLDLAFIQEKTYILRDYTTTDSALVGAELLAINGEPIDRIIGDFSTFLQGETTSFIKKSLESDLFKIMYWMFYPEESLWWITYRTPDGREATEPISGITGNELVRLRTALGEMSRIAYALHILPEQQTAIMTVHTFRGPELKAFYRKAFRKIRRARVQHLIIDLRDNLGGNTANADELLSYLTETPLHPISVVRMKVSSQLKQYNRRYLSDIFLWARLYLFNTRFHQIFTHQNGTLVDINVNDAIQPKRKRLRFDGDVYVMTNGHSFSAGAYFPTFVKHYNLGCVVGSETGGLSGGSFGERISVALPTTNISLGISTIILKTKPLNQFSKHGVIPDFSIRRDISKEIHGVDSQLEQTLQIIGSHNITKGE